MDLNIESVQGIVMEWAPNIVMALVIFFVGKWLARMLSNALAKGMRRAGQDETLIGFVRNIAYVALFAFAIIGALAELGIQTTSFIAIIGAAGLAVGLALQGSLANFAAGVMLILFKPFKVGDFIEAGGTSGVVEEIMIFSTRMKSPDNKAIFVPNGSIINGNIVNVSANDTRRVDMVFGCGYDDDILKVKSLLEEIIKADERVLPEPAPAVLLVELADSSINFAVRPWVKSADYFGVLATTNEQVKLRFDQEGLSIPYPQSDVHMYQKAA